MSDYRCDYDDLLLLGFLLDNGTKVCFRDWERVELRKFLAQTKSSISVTKLPVWLEERLRQVARKVTDAWLCEKQSRPLSGYKSRKERRKIAAMIAWLPNLHNLLSRIYAAGAATSAPQ